MFKRKSVVYAFVVTSLLLSVVFGAYTVNAQTGTTPTATPAEETTQATPPFDPSQMAGTMTSMLDQMEAMIAAAPDNAARQRMAPAMMNALNGMMGLNQMMMDQMQSMPSSAQQAMAGPMMKTMTRMTGMMNQMQPMMGETSPMTGTMPMSRTQSMKPMGSDMQMGQMMRMMGQMMQMMGGGMMAQGGAGMMGDTAPMSGTMPMSGTQSMKPLGGDMQMGQMMGMMGQMMQMMGGGMMAQSGAGMMGDTAPMSGTMPMSRTQSMKPMGGDMPMEQMMGMMGQMMQMMGHMQGMMGEGIGQSDAISTRQAQVAERGAQVMPFDLEQTIHIFTNLDNGGLQQVVVKEGADGAQVRLIQMHLSQEAENFSSGNFGDPAQIHGEAMPGLAVLRERASEIAVQYTALDNGGQIAYTSSNPELVAAIHAWFDAQLSDHGNQAMPSTMLAKPTVAQVPATTEQTPQSLEGGGVTVKVTPLSLMDETVATLSFEVVLDTHSVELNYDVAQLAILRDNLGNEYQPAAWTPAQSGGHHVNGLLNFADRATILQDGVTELTLDVMGIAGVPNRAFSWGIGK